MNKVVKIILWIVGGVLALLLLLSLVGGPVAKGYINGSGEKLTSRKVHVNHVGLNLFTGHVNVRGLNLYEEDGETAFVSFDTLDVRAHLLRAIGKTLDIRHLTLSGLNVNVEQNGSQFNFTSMLDHFKGDEEKEKDTTPSSWVLRLGDLRLNHAQAAYHDLQRGKQWRIADMNLHVPGFVIGGKEQTQAGLNIALEDGGQLNVSTDYDAESNNYSATVNISDFALLNIKEYLTDIMAISNLDGSLNARLKATGNLSEVMKSRLSGDIELANAGVRSIVVGPEDIVSLNSFKVSIKEINLEERRFAFDEILVDGLAATYEQWPDGSTLNRLLKKNSDESNESDLTDESDQPDQPKQSSKPMQISVGRLAVINCNVTYDNHALPDEFHFPVTGINVEAQDLTTAGRNNARVRAMLPGGGTLAVRWTGNISDMAEYQDLLLVVNGLDMKQLSPWLVAYTGQPIEDGVFGLRSHNTIAGGNIDGHNAVDIYKITVGKRRKDVEPKQKLPVKAALYILKDKDEKINIELPVSGNVNDPEFNYMKVVWKTLGNLLVKVATSPARAIAGAVGGNGDMDFIEMSPEQFGFTSEQYHALGELAKLTEADSLLVLDMQLHGMDSVHAEVLNNQLLRHMTEIGVPESQLKITVGEPVERTGYSISSELKIEE